MTKMTNQFIEERWSITNGRFKEKIKKGLDELKKDFKDAKLWKKKPKTN